MKYVVRCLCDLTLTMYYSRNSHQRYKYA